MNDMNREDSDCRGGAGGVRGGVWGFTSASYARMGDRLLEMPLSQAKFFIPLFRLSLPMRYRGDSHNGIITRPMQAESPSPTHARC